VYSDLCHFMDAVCFWFIISLFFQFKLPSIQDLCLAALDIRIHNSRIVYKKRKLKLQILQYCRIHMYMPHSPPNNRYKVVNKVRRHNDKDKALIIIIIIIMIIPRQCLSCCCRGRAIARVHPVHLINVEWRRAAADPRPSQTTGCESTCTGCQSLHPPSPFITITRPES